MNNSIKETDLLDKWMNKEIDDSILEEELNWTKEDIENETSLHMAALKSIEMAAIRSQVSKIHQEYITENKAAARIVPLKQKQSKNWVFRIAASITLLIGLFIGKELFLNSTDSLSKEFMQSYTLVTARGGEEVLTEKILRDFKNQNYKDVISDYSELVSPTNQETFLTGYAMLENDLAKDAIALFESISKNQNESVAYKDEAEYYSAVAYLKINNKSKAMEILTAIKNNPDHSFNKAVNNWKMLQLKFGFL